MEFDEARDIIEQRLQEEYAGEPEEPKVLAYGFDTGDSWAPMIDWDRVLGTYIFLVNKETGELTPLSFPEFGDLPQPQFVGSWPPEWPAGTGEE